MMKLFAGAGYGTIHFPDALFPMEGFCGIHDAPKCRVLALECGEKAALVALELVMLPPELVEMVKSIVADHTGAKKENIWVHTTHAITTPHAPHAPMGMGGVKLEISEADQKDLDKKIALYADALKTAVTEAAKGAADTYQPAALGIGQAQSHVSINRDVETPFGWWIGQNPEGKTNPNFDLFRFDGEDGKIIAAILTGGLKPCAIDNSQMKENKRLVSSDVPGLSCRLIEDKLQAPCLFFMGAAGDQVPKEQALVDEVLPDGTVKAIDLGVEKGLEIVARLGHQLAEDVLPALQSIHCRETAPAIAVAETHILWGGKQTAKYPTDNKILYYCIRTGFTVMVMCPIMCFYSNIINMINFHWSIGQFLEAWISKMPVNWVFAFGVQIWFLGPINRFLFSRIFAKELAAKGSNSR